jgi:hypothetical protein
VFPPTDPITRVRPAHPPPGSVVIPVSSRHQWLSCTSELYHLAWEALRRPKGCPLGVGCGKGFAETTPPVSREFIEQRADIDEPQLGYTVRRGDTGQLQGFAWATTFTNWTHYFKWDSLASQSGLRRPGAGDAGRALDVDGSLAEALEAQPRHGDPNISGVVWPTVAEVALVGGLGCGSYLLRLLLEMLEQEGTYQFVVLQATNNSVSFYQRHGFVRVGAVARYSRRRSGGAAEVVGYRHWLATDEELHPSDKPSYMMALRLQPHGGAKPKPGSLLARLPALVPKRLPTIQTTPVPPDLLNASAAVDALSAGAIERAQELLEQAGGALAEPQQEEEEDGDGEGREQAAGGHVGEAPAVEKSRGVEDPRKAARAAKAKAAARRRAADRKLGLPPRPRGRPPKGPGGAEAPAPPPTPRVAAHPGGVDAGHGAGGGAKGGVKRAAPESRGNRQPSAAKKPRPHRKGTRQGLRSHPSGGSGEGPAKAAKAQPLTSSPAPQGLWQRLAGWVSPAAH